MNYVKHTGYESIAERRLKARKRVNFLLDDTGLSSRRRNDAQDPWTVTQRSTTNRVPRWDAFEKWQREAKQAQAKNVDGVAKLPRKLSLKAIFKK